jgi:hypothetical protein
MSVINRKQDVFGKDKSPCRLVYGVATFPLGTPVEWEAFSRCRRHIEHDEARYRLGFSDVSLSGCSRTAGRRSRSASSKKAELRTGAENSAAAAGADRRVENVSRGDCASLCFGVPGLAGLAGSCRTFPEGEFGPETGFKALKIPVSVVRFRPWAPSTSEHRAAKLCDANRFNISTVLRRTELHGDFSIIGLRRIG